MSTKTVGNSHLAWQDIAANAVATGVAIDITTLRAIAFHVLLGRAGGTAFSTNYPTLRFEASGKSTGNDAWIPLLHLQPAVGASIANTTLNGAVSAGATTCIVTLATNIAIGDSLFLGHTTLTANYELVRVKAISGTTVTFEEACTNAHDTAALVTSQPERYWEPFDVSPYTRGRTVIDNAGNAQALRAQVLYTTFA